jgi:hypothetical protein
VHIEGVKEMNRDSVLAKAKDAGLIAMPCANEKYVAVQCGVAPDTNERMRITGTGELLTVHEGYYWQVCEISDLKNYLESE